MTTNRSDQLQGTGPDDLPMAKVKWRPTSMLTVTAKGFAWLLLAVAALLALGLGLTLLSKALVHAPTLDKSALDAAALVLGFVTAACFAYSDTTPTATDEAKRSRQESRRDWVKLITHGGAIVVTAYLAWAALDFPFLPQDSPIRG